MKLPVIKHISNFIEEHDVDFVHESIELLEYLSESPGIKDEELDVIGELLSNMYGSIEVQKKIEEGVPQREALNGFMQRVMGSIN
ncbi:DUF6952 family protein [Parvicella tangerina]|uniref:Uncharacterized protein n=1 Tax=Parvicella tangerina TaxID=2829795 RepID=A0A916JL65_9FLAO|nr:hypothetical protein [Parvicella tangerina]CAG5079482.1 hypothetical protein CRYO30217_00956 [Parvicella tangerina]